jgi:hypothetical protein
MAAADSADTKTVALGRFRLSLALIALIALLAPAAADCQTDPAFWRFVYPGAKVLTSINWQRVRQLPPVAAIREKLVNEKLATTVPGLELWDAVDRILISSPGIQSSGTPDAGNPAAGGAAAESAEIGMLFAVEGHFDGAKVRQFFTLLETKPQAYNSFQVYRPQAKGAKNMAYVLFDAGTILFGDAPLVFATLDRNQFGPPAPPAGSIIARAAEMEAAYEFWMVMSQPDLLSNDRLAGLFPGSDWAADAQAFEAGMNLRSGLTADITVHFGSEASAQQVVKEMTRVIREASKEKIGDPQTRDIAKKLKLIAEGPAAKISLHLTPQELEQYTQAFEAGRKAAVAAAAARAKSPAFPAPAPDKPGAIRIEGLDDGPREIPYPGEQH